MHLPSGEHLPWLLQFFSQVVNSHIGPNYWCLQKHPLFILTPPFSQTCCNEQSRPYYPSWHSHLPNTHFPLLSEQLFMHLMCPCSFTSTLDSHNVPVNPELH